MSITTVIAIAGLGLGIINTSTTIYKEFIKKNPSPSLEVHCDKALWRYYPGNDKTQCQMLIDLTVIPRNSANGIKKIVFINKKYDEIFGGMGDKQNWVTFYKIEDNIYGDNLFSKFNHDELKEFITEKNKDYRRDVRNINLPKDNAYSFSLVEKFDGQRYPDGYEDIPIDGWWVEIYDSSNKKFETEIEFNLSK